MLLGPDANKPYTRPTSPRTTRRNILANEITDELRKELLLERRQRHAPANAIKRRRHIAKVSELQQNYSDHYLESDPSEEYHVKGW